MDRQTDRQLGKWKTDRWIGKQIDDMQKVRQTYRQTDGKQIDGRQTDGRNMDIQKERQVNRKTSRQALTNRHTDICNTGRQTYGDVDRERGRSNNPFLQPREQSFSRVQCLAPTLRR
jgi:hypothetical protein